MNPAVSVRHCTCDCGCNRRTQGASRYASDACKMRLHRWRQRHNLPVGALPPVWGEGDAIRCTVKGCSGLAEWSVSALVNTLVPNGKTLLRRLAEALTQSPERCYLVCERHVDRLEEELESLSVTPVVVQPYRQDIP